MNKILLNENLEKKNLLCYKIILDSNNEYDLIDKIKLNFDDLKKELR